MDKMLEEFENLKISAFTKYSKLTGDINNVTIGPNSTLLQNSTTIKKKPTPPKPKKPIKQSSQSKNEQLPITQVLKEFDNQRKEKLQEAIDDHYTKFEHFMQQQTKQNEWFLKQQAFIKSMHENEQIILQTVDQTNGSRSDHNEKLSKHYQEMIQRKIQCEQQLEKNKEKQRLLNENIERIRRYQNEFRIVYQEIITIIKTCTSSEELKKLLGDNFKLLKILPESFEEIIQKCKTYKIDEEQALKALNVLNQVKRLKTQVEEAVNKINTKRKEEELKISTPVKENLAKPPASSLDQCISASNLKRYSDIKQFLAQHTETFKVLFLDETLKQFKFDCIKAVNIPVNAISSISADHLTDKYAKLNSLLLGKTVIVSDRQFNASKHPQGIPFCMDLLAKKFVLQGDLIVSNNPETAFCYASVIISLWNDFPDFGKLLLGYFYTQCPYLVPYYIPRTEGQSDEDYYVSLGYAYANGQIEKQDKFIKRMTGILRLYFAILIARPKRSQAKNPHNIKHAWTYLTSLLKLEPLLDITATALHTFLVTIGFEMETVYGVAFKKLMRIVICKFMPVLKQIDTGGPVSRLEKLLQDYTTKGHFDKPKGILPNNFW